MTRFFFVHFMVVPIFSFHSGIWINLHHFLYNQALLKVHSSGRNSRGLVSGDTAVFNKLEPGERAQWEKAIDYYAKYLIHRDLLFDSSMVRAKDYLEDQEALTRLSGTVPGGTDLGGAVLAADWQADLNAVVDSYRLHFWPQQNSANQQWVSGLMPLLQRYGPTVAAQLTKYYKTPWPADTIRVDVTNYASWAGAYTSTHPNRITVSSVDTSNQGTAALEVLFHEASHIIIDSIADRINEIAAQEKKTLPNPVLWHAVLFYSTGEIVRRVIGNYTPYAYRNGLWRRAWPMYIQPLEKDWQPYLDDRATLDAALKALIGDI